MDEQTLRQQVMGARIRARRDALNLSQRALAARVGVTQGSITGWERGEQVPRWPELRRLATALDVPGHWIIEPLTDDWTRVRTEVREDDHDLGS